MDQHSLAPHVLIFPFPAQGHVTPMLNLAELLCLANVKITFLNTIHNQQCLTKHTDIEARLARYPGFRFKTISDGHPDDHPRLGGDWLREMLQTLPSSAKPQLREILVNATGIDKVTCFLLDGWMSFARDLAKEAKVPVIAVRFGSACFTWSIKCTSELIEAGEIPFKDYKITLLNTTFIHQPLLRYTYLKAHFACTENSGSGQCQTDCPMNTLSLERSNTGAAG